MVGTVLEHLSTRKLIILLSIFLTFPIICILIGGCIAPSPTNVVPIRGYKCLTEKVLDVGEENDIWYFPHGEQRRRNVHCIPVDVDFDESVVPIDVAFTSKYLVFAFQTPVSRNGSVLNYSRWMQNFVGLLQVDIVYDHEKLIGRKQDMTLDVRIGYRNKCDPDDKWMLLAHSIETRHLDCTIDDDKKIDGLHYDCKRVPLFELGSLHHEHYLLNMRLPTCTAENCTVNRNIGHIDDLWLVIIHPDSKFVQMMVSIKALFFVLVLWTVIWYRHRFCKVFRSPVLFERTLLSLGIALSSRNLPLEYMSLYFEMPFMLLLNNIQEMIFYTALLCFWLAFCGEHIMDNVEYRNIHSYRKISISVSTCCLFLFGFDICERIFQLENPFFSLWALKYGGEMSCIFLGLACLCAAVYFFCLCSLISKVFQSFRTELEREDIKTSAEKLYFEGLTYRFKFLMAFTMACIVATFCLYLLSELSQGPWRWSNIKFNFTSAFFMGSCGLWNMYVITVLVLFAPSTKPHDD